MSVRAARLTAAVAALALLGVLAVLAGPRAVGVAVVVLVLPGVALTAFIPGMEPLERAALALAGSISVTALTGLIIGLSPIELDEKAWAIGLGVNTLVCLAAGLATSAHLRGRQGDREARRVSVRPLSVVAFVVAAVIVAGAVAIARDSAVEARDNTRFTELWLVPGPRQAELGVTNREGEDAGYVVEVIDDEGSRVAGRFTLPPGRSWTRRIDLPRPGAAEPLRAVLRKKGSTRILRHVDLWPRS